MDKYIVEFIGTFLLVASCVLSSPTKYKFIVVGITVAVLILCGPKISNGQFILNPATAFMMNSSQKISNTDTIYYVLLELGAAFLAVKTINAIKPNYY